MSHRAKVVNGVKHGGRGPCACPICDPDDLLRAQAFADRHARPVVPVVPTVAEVLRCVSPPRRPRWQPSDSPESKRFRELLREGRSAAAALEILASEKGTP